MSAPSSRWYLTPVGRLIRASLGLPFLGASVYLLSRGGGALSLVAGGACLIFAASLPWAAVVQEPD
jgi:hypothetical protein